LKKKAEKDKEGAAEKTVWEKFLEKKKEKRKEVRKARKAERNEEKEEKQTPEGQAEQKVRSLTSTCSFSQELEARRRAELELVMMPESVEAAGHKKKGFNLSRVADDAVEKSSSKARKKAGKADTDVQKGLLFFPCGLTLWQVAMTAFRLMWRTPALHPCGAPTLPSTPLRRSS
jgi:hypothetical protein